MHSHDRYAHQILAAIESGQDVSQRTLAGHLGIALGLTNLLVRRIVRKGWVKVVRIQPNRVRYLLTPAGVAEKARISRLFLQHSVRFYMEARHRVLASLAEVSASLPGTSSHGGRHRIVFYGANEVAEIAYVCLQETDLELVGVVQDGRDRPFFGVPIHPSRELRDGRLADVTFDRLIVTEADDRDTTAALLASLGVTDHRVWWL